MYDPLTASNSSKNAPFAELAKVYAHAKQRERFLQQTVFSKIQEEVVAILEVIPAGSTPDAGPPETTTTTTTQGGPAPHTYLVVLTLSTAPTAQVNPRSPSSAEARARAASPYTTPRLHHLKVKGPGVYHTKKSKHLKDLSAVRVSSGNRLVFRYGQANGRAKEYAFVSTNPALTRPFIWWVHSLSTIYVPDTARDMVASADKGAMAAITASWMRLVESFDVADPTGDATVAGAQRLLNEVQLHVLRGIVAQRALAKGKAAPASHKETPAKGKKRKKLPSLADEEAQQVVSFLKAFDLGDGDIDVLEAKLREKLAHIQQANIETLFAKASIESTSAIVDRVDSAASLAHDVGVWLGNHDSHLHNMRTGMESIESKNAKLELQEHNHEVLSTTLGTLIDRLQLDPRVIQTLTAPSFTCGAELDRTLHAVQALESVIRTKFQSSLEETRAIKEQRTLYVKLRNEFCRAAVDALGAAFTRIASTLQSPQLTSRAAVLSVQSHSSAQKQLRADYLPLIKHVEQLHPNYFVALRPKYVACFGRVYKAKLDAYFATAHQLVAVEATDSRMANFEDFVMVPGSEHGASASAAGGLGGVGAGPVEFKRMPSTRQLKKMKRSNSRASHDVSANAGGEALTTVFRRALQAMFPLTLAEHEFLMEVFGFTLPSIVRKREAEARARDRAQKSAGNGTSSIVQSLHGHANAALEASEEDDEDEDEEDGAQHKEASKLTAVDEKQAADNAEKVHAMMDGLFAGLDKHFKDLADVGQKMSSFYVLDMLLNSEDMLKTVRALSDAGKGAGGGTSSDMHMARVMMSVQAHLKSLFNAFVNSEIAWIEGCRVGAKRAGVLPPFSKFPGFVQLMERVVRGFDRSESVDMTYKKMAVAMFRWLNTVARTDEKYEDIVLMENYHFFWRVFSTFPEEVVPLRHSVEEAHKLYKSHMARYVTWSIGYGMGPLARFWTKLERQLAVVSSSKEVVFTEGLSKHDLRLLFKQSLSQRALAKSVSNVFRRICKHLPDNIMLVQEVWQHLTHEFITRYERFDELIADCYTSEKLPLSSDSVAALFVKHTADAAAIAAEGGRAETLRTRRESFDA